MKKSLIIFSLFSLVSLHSFAQTTLKEHKVGHEFYVSLPDYMSKTIGLNSAAVFQFRNNIKDIAGFIIEDNKEELELAQVKFSSINEFYDIFIKDFLIKQEDRVLSQSLMQTKGKNNFVEGDVSCHAKDSKVGIYYFVGIAETKSAYYKVLCYCSVANKDKFKADFQKILYSIKD